MSRSLRQPALTLRTADGPACRRPVQHGVMSRAESEADGMELYRKLRLPDPENIGFAIRIRYLAVSCSVR